MKSRAYSERIGISDSPTSIPLIGAHGLKLDKTLQLPLSAYQAQTLERMVRMAPRFVERCLPSVAKHAPQGREIRHDAAILIARLRDPN